MQRQIRAEITGEEVVKLDIDPELLLSLFNECLQCIMLLFIGMPFTQSVYVHTRFV